VRFDYRGHHRLRLFTDCEGDFMLVNIYIMIEISAVIDGDVQRNANAVDGNNIKALGED
jgi:hypothetical protein